MTDNAVIIKCLVWDLDNTLWQGTLLEGDQVQLPDAVREVIVELDTRGILHSVASKNDREIAWERMETLGIAEYFVVPEIGWGPKSDSVRRIADRLNFAHRAIAFIDDQPVERAEVAYYLPDVRCYPAERASMLPELPEFSPAVTTVDSRRRRQMYQAGFRRDAERADFTGPDEEFLRSLELVMRIGRATEEDLSRVEELTVRTSQMNATGVYYSAATLRGLLADPRHEVLVVTLADRFGPHGAVGILLLEKYPALGKHPGVWHLKLLATSCRVVSFGAGSTILNWLINQAALARAHLVADFRGTDRNRMMEVTYRFAGFSEQRCVCRTCISQHADREGIQRLHLQPVGRREPTAIRILAPQLAEEGPTSAGLQTQRRVRHSERSAHG
ncbi:MAG: HAD-IIIC family phosphatase [Pseudonocardiales bacterium]|nr:HAD-IIIC family phosphatase [Pseudonocardiales bacterium]